MKCPNCTDSSLVARRYEWLRVDACPTCEGVWLPRGEFDAVFSQAQRTRMHADEDWRDAHISAQHESGRPGRTYRRVGADEWIDEDDDRHDGHGRHRYERHRDDRYDRDNAHRYRRKSWIDHFKDLID